LHPSSQLCNYVALVFNEFNFQIENGKFIYSDFILGKGTYITNEE